MAAGRALLAGLLSVVLLLSPAAAFAVYNDGTAGPVTFLAWPPAAQTFKAVVDPGSSAACPFSDDTCTAIAEGDSSSNPIGQCGNINMFIKAEALDTDAITQQFILDEVKEILDPILSVAKLVAGFIPEVGQAVKLGLTLVKEGIDLADVVAQTGINFEYDDIFLNGGNGGQFHYTDDNNYFSTIAENC